MGIFSKFKQDVKSKTESYKEARRRRGAYHDAAIQRTTQTATNPIGSARDYFQRRQQQREERENFDSGSRFDFGRQLEARRKKAVFRKSLYKEEREKAQQAKFEYETRRRARQDVWGRGPSRPLGESLSIYGHAAQKTYGRARQRGLIDALISGDTGQRGRFDARRPDRRGYKDYYSKESIFGTPKKRKLKRSKRSRSSGYWNGSYIPQGPPTRPQYERSVTISPGRGAVFRKPSRQVNRRSMSGIELMHLRQMATKAGIPAGDFDSTAYIDSSLSYNENKENLQREIAQVGGGQGGDYMSDEDVPERKSNEQMMSDWKEELEWKAKHGDEEAQRVLDSLKQQGR